MGARQHLQSLEDNELVKFEDVKVKVGRPNRHWSLTEKAQDRFSDKHKDLTVQFIDAIEHLFGTDALDKVCGERESNTLANYQHDFAELPDLESKVIKLAELRARDGYMAEWEKVGEQYRLIENHCPICKAATRCQVLCQSELNVFRALVGDKVAVERDEHIVQGARRCVYTFSEQS